MSLARRRFDSLVIGAGGGSAMDIAKAAGAGRLCLATEKDF